MAKSTDPVPFELNDGWEGSQVMDNTCPDCGGDSVATYMDRYSSYEYCTACDWSEEDEDQVASSKQSQSKRSRYSEEA